MWNNGQRSRFDKMRDAIRNITTFHQRNKYAEDDDEEQNGGFKKKKKKPFSLPHWTVYFAWIRMWFLLSSFSTLVIYRRPIARTSPSITTAERTVLLSAIVWECSLQSVRLPSNASIPKIWNSLRPAVCACNSPDTLRRHLKTHYFQQAFLTHTYLPQPHRLRNRILSIFVHEYKFTYLLTYGKAVWWSSPPTRRMISQR